MLEFTKVEGLGNDFALLDRREGSAHSLETLSRLAPQLCDRRLGIGGDGLLLVEAPSGPKSTSGALARMIVINHDGSRPEMCGNGLRCVALHLAVATGQRDFMVETDAGLLRCEVVELEQTTERQLAQVRVAMGPARRLGARHPAASPGREFAAVSMGNPHAIHFVRDEDPETLARELGPGIERDPLFPKRTNVEFVRREADGSLTTWVWERGCGITQACGTGACATAAAAVDHGLAEPERPIRIKLPGGALTIRVPADPQADVMMTGPARVAFHGAVPWA